MAVTWEKLAYQDDVITKALFAAKGDLLGASADDTPGILSIGTNTHVLTADSGETLGIKWAAAPGAQTGGEILDLFEALSDESWAQQFSNLLKNGSFEDSALPVANTPSGWTLEGTPTVAVETTNIAVGYGTRSAKITGTGAANEGLNQTITGLKASTTYSILWHSMATAEDTARLLTTGATTNADTDVTATSMTQSVDTFVTDASGTDVVLKVVAKVDTDIVYFDNIIVVEGTVAPAFFPYPNDEHLKAIDYQDITPANFDYGLLRMECGRARLTFDGVQNYAPGPITFGTAFTKILAVSAVAVDYVGLTAPQIMGASAICYLPSTTTISIYCMAGDETIPDANDTIDVMWIAIGVGP